MIDLGAAPRGARRPPARPHRAAALVRRARGRHRRRQARRGSSWSSDDPLLAWMVVDATLASGADAALPAVHRRPAGRTRGPSSSRARTASCSRWCPTATGDEVVFYDALIDPDLAIAVLHLVSPDIEVEVRRPIVLEHSNSSVVFDERTILKVLRKVEPGPNPDVEIPRVLAERGYEHVLPPHRRAPPRRHGPRGAPRLPRRAPPRGGSSPARRCATCWRRACRPRRAAATSRPTPPGSAPSIAGSTWPWPTPGAASPATPPRWVDQMLGGLDEVARPRPAPTARRRRGAGPVRRRRRLDDAGAEIRIHGDLHLAQVIQVDAGWLVLDFEGEPARRRDDRFTTSSPLRDVAGMLRSLHYAAATGLAEWDQGDAELLALLDAWEQRNRDAFLAAYYGEEGIDALLPGRPRRPRRAADRLRARQGRVRARLRARPPPRPRVDPAGGHRAARAPSRAHVTDVRRAADAPTEFDLHLFGQGKHERLWDVLGAHVRRTASGTASRVWAPHAAPVSVVGEFNGWDRGACPLERARRRRVGRRSCAGIGSRTPVQVRDHGRRRAHDRPRRPDGAVRRALRRHGQHRVREPARVAGRRLDGAPRRRRPGARPHEHLRGAPRLVAPPRRRPGAVLPRAGARARRPRHRARVHPRRADADRRAPLRAVVGLPGHRLLRAHLALRRPRRLPLVRRPPPPARPRRDRRLGARPLPARRRRAWRATTARRSTSTPTRSAASTPTGARSCSTTASPRCAASSSPTPSTGSASCTSTACASTPSPRCSTATTPAAHGQWTPNVHGGNEDLEAVAFLQEMNTTVHRVHPGVLTIAEESTAWDGVSRPVHAGGLGFTHKWNMGWMHDTLDYWSTDPVLPELAPQPAHLRAHLRVGRALRAAAQPRRGRAPQAVAARQDARQQRPRALRQPAGPLHVDVGAPRQAAPLHGRRAGRPAGVEPRPRARLEPRRPGPPRRRAAPRRRPQRHPGAPPGDARRRRRPGRRSPGWPSTTASAAPSPSSASCPAPTTCSCAWPTSRACTSTTTASACAARGAGAASSPATTPATAAPAPGCRTSRPSRCPGTTAPTAPPSRSRRSPSSTSSPTR